MNYFWLGLLNPNWGPGPVNTNWGPRPGARAWGQAKSWGPGNTKTRLKAVYISLTFVDVINGGMYS